MKFINKNWHKLVLFAHIFFMPVFMLYADTHGTVDPVKLVNPIPNITSIPNLIQTILEGIIKIGIPIVALAIVYCGFLFVFARGNSEKLTKAKDALLFTLIGAAVLLGSWAIAKMISATITGLGS